MRDNDRYIRHQRGGIKDYLAKKIILIKIAEEIISGDIYSAKPNKATLDEINKFPEPVKCAGLEGEICYLKQFDIF